MTLSKHFLNTNQEVALGKVEQNAHRSSDLLPELGPAL
jgi:hypothetical protein